MLPFDKYPCQGRVLLRGIRDRNPARLPYEILYQLTGLDACAYCGGSLLDPFERWQILQCDHVVPQKEGERLGIPTEWSEDLINIVLACSPCNGYDNKYRLPPGTALPQSVQEFATLRDRVFEERKARILQSREEKRQHYETRPWELPLNGPAAIEP